ncbi:MAG: hypothetical protein LBV21_01890, partial [Candidatus Adiutrix sp.]|nr:hypothetical protein [Candidatus Adiutrix sp.]
MFDIVLSIFLGIVLFVGLIQCVVGGIKWGYKFVKGEKPSISSIGYRILFWVFIIAVFGIQGILLLFCMDFWISDEFGFWIGGLSLL